MATIYAAQPICNFRAVQVENGWIVSINGDPMCIAPQYVFPSLVELSDWLRVQVTQEKQ